MTKRDEMMENLDKLIAAAEKMRTDVEENGDLTITIILASGIADGELINAVKSIVGPEYLVAGLLNFRRTEKHA